MRRQRQQGVSYKAWDARSGRMRLVRPIPPQLLNVRIKKPTTNTKGSTSPPSLQVKAARSAIQHVYSNISSTLRVPLSEVIGTIPFQLDVKDALAALQSQWQWEWAFSLLDSTYILSNAHIQSYQHGLKEARLYHRRNKYPYPSKHFDSVFYRNWGLYYDRMNPIQINTGWLVCVPDEKKKQLLFLDENASLFQLLMLYMLPTNVAPIFKPIRTQLVRRWRVAASDVDEWIQDVPKVMMN